MSTQDQDRVITHKGAEYRIVGRAWWTSTALDTGSGRVEVARIHAYSTTLRKPSQAQLDADPSLNRYWGDAGNQGRLAVYMLGLTDADLDDLDITPGRLVYPEVVDAGRPAGNRIDKPTSLRQAQQAQDWLQNDCIGKPSDY